MAVIAHVIVRGVTTEQYDAVRSHAGWLEHAPGGGLAHLTWWEGADCHNMDAWESEAAFAAFGEQRLGPAMAAAGVLTEPEVTFHPAHEVYLPEQVIDAPTASLNIAAADNIAILRRGYRAFADGDVAAVLALFDPSITWYAPDTVRFGGTYVGPGAVGEFFATLPENFAELHVEPSMFIDHGDTVAVTGRHRGRSAAGIDFDVPFVHVWTVSNGKATSFTEYFDTVKMNAALGLVSQSGMEAKAPAPAG